MSLFITFEGGEGSGKSTQVATLVERINKEKKRHAVFAREPGTTLLGKMLRDWLSHRDHSLTLIPAQNTQLCLIEPIDEMNEHLLPDILLHGAAPRTELLAFTIARAQLVEEFISPHLKKGDVVICDRYIDSTVAYQGYARGLSIKLVELANKIATDGLKPKLTILLDLPPEVGLARKWGGSKEDQFEREVLDFHCKVRNGYLQIAAKEPARFLVVDATKTKGEIEKIIWQKVEPLLPKAAISKS